jgi:hypothetical protein
MSIENAFDRISCFRTCPTWSSGVGRVPHLDHLPESKLALESKQQIFGEV